MASHTFNPSTREVETGVIMGGQREEYKVGGDRSSVQSELSERWVQSEEAF